MSVPSKKATEMASLLQHLPPKKGRNQEIRGMDVEVESVASAVTEKSKGDRDAATGNGNGKNSSNLKKNLIHVSNKKKPLFFYVNLAKRYIQQHEEVELSALGMAIATVITIAEILKNNGLATEKKILTSSVGMKDGNKGRTVQKIEIVLAKSENFDTLMSLLLLRRSNAKPG